MPAAVGRPRLRPHRGRFRGRGPLPPSLASLPRLPASTDLSIRILLIVASMPRKAAAAVCVARHAPARDRTRLAFVP